MTNTRTKILTINFGGIGDEVLFLPTLEGIRASFPEARITLLVEPRSKGIGVITDLVDEVVTFDIKKRPLYGPDLIELLTILRAHDYDMVVSSGSSPMVSGLLFLSGIPRRIGYSNRLASYLLTDPMPLNRYQYAGKMYHDLIAGLPGAAAALPAIPRIKAGLEEKQSMESLLVRLAQEGNNSGKSNSAASKQSKGNRKRVLFHPGTSRLAILKGLNKTWSAENWCKLAELLSKEPGFEVDVVLAGGPDDEEAIKQIQSLLKPDARVICTYGHTRNLRELVALIDICDVIVCVDSAPMHLSIALNKPTVALFGPTNEAVLMPSGVEHFVALRKETLPASIETISTSAEKGAYNAPLQERSTHGVDPTSGNAADRSTHGVDPASAPTMRQASFLYPGAPAVQLPAEIVAQSVVDQLKRDAHPNGSPAVHAG